MERQTDERTAISLRAFLREGLQNKHYTHLVLHCGATGAFSFAIKTADRQSRLLDGDSMK